MQMNEDFNIVTEIIPGVYLANNNVASNSNFYVEKGIKGIINCSRDLPFYVQDLHQLRLNIDDNPSYINEFYKSLNICMEFINTHKPVLIHCFAGMSRSASLYAAYLIKYHNQTPASAVQTIINVRPFSFNYGKTFYYADALNKFYSDVHGIIK